MTYFNTDDRDINEDSLIEHLKNNQYEKYWIKIKITGKVFKYIQNANLLFINKFDNLNPKYFKYLKNIKRISIDLRYEKYEFVDKLFSEIKNVENLDINYEYLVDEDIKNFTNLKKLSLKGCKNFKGLYLKNYSNLEKLEIVRSYIDGKNIEDLKNLKYLRVVQSDYISAKNIENLKQLEKLRYFQNDTYNQMFNGFNNLKHLEFDEGNCTDEVFKNIPFIETLNISASNFTDNIFQYLPKLKNLDIKYCKKIKNIYNASQDLENLQCSANNIEMIKSIFKRENKIKYLFIFIKKKIQKNIDYNKFPPNYRYTFY